MLRFWVLLLLVLTMGCMNNTDVAKKEMAVREPPKTPLADQQAR